jgi:hypothetical protein
MTMLIPDRIDTLVHAPLHSQWKQEKRPPLNVGDRPSRAEFERRYQVHPEIQKAELIEGIAHMPSPVRCAQHSRPHVDIITWFGIYRVAPPGAVGVLQRGLASPEHAACAASLRQRAV